MVLATILPIFPFIGVIGYLMVRPVLTLADKQELELDAELKKELLKNYGKCSNCGYDVKSDYVVCPKCQNKINDVCSSCGKALDIGWRACPYCGTPKNIDNTFADIPLDLSNIRAHKSTSYSVSNNTTKDNTVSSVSEYSHDSKTTKVEQDKTPVTITETTTGTKTNTTSK